MTRNVMVEICTDHEDSDEALTSVVNGLKRAGYDVLDSAVLPSVFPTTYPDAPFPIATVYAHVAISAAEPEVERVGDPK